MEDGPVRPLVAENPYGYAVKKAGAPSGKGHLICIAGEGANSFLPDGEYGGYNIRGIDDHMVIVNFKGKGVEVTVFVEGLTNDVELNALEQIEKKWFFQRSPVPHCLGYILEMGKFDENSLGALLDSNFLLTVKVENVDRYMMIRYTRDNSEAIEDETFDAIGRWIGSVAKVTITNLHDKEEIINSLGQSVAFNFTIPDHKKMQQQHQFFAEARWGSLKKFQSSKLDPLTTKDPLGNTVAHLAILNIHSDVFPFIAAKFPALLTAQNVFGNTPLHNLSLLRTRKPNAEYFEWNFIWSLPWNFALKNKKDQTAVEKLCEINGDELVKALKALLDNKIAWQSVQKCHDVSKLMSAALVQYLATVSKEDEDAVLITAKLFIAQGASVKGAVFEASLRHSHGKVAHHFLELGAEVSYESLVAAFSTHERAIADIALQRFNLKTLKPEQSKILCDTAVQAAWIDVLTLLASSGCIIPLFVNSRPTTTLAMANVVARMNSKIVLPLKFLGVDAVDETVENSKREKLLQTLPEELRDMFHEKEMWRWTLFLEDEEKRNRFLQLYGAIARAQRETDNVKELQISIRDFEFSVGIICKESFHQLQLIGFQIWIGGENQPEEENLIYKITSFSNSNPKKSMKPSMRKEEKNLPVLEQILQAIGWPLKDKHIFLTICSHAFPYQDNDGIFNPDQKIPAGKIHVRSFFYPTVLAGHEFSPSKWYMNVVKQVYGVDAPLRKRKMTDSNSESDDEES